jgi:hypothetical protein
VTIAALSVTLSGFFLYRLLRPDFDRDLCRYVTLLFLLIPAIQVYYCASLDAVVAGFFLGTLASLRHTNAPLSVFGTILCLFCASFLTFAACFLLPVIIGFEIITKRTVWKSVVVILAVAAIYAAIYQVWGYNYLASFRTASALENPRGFLLLAEPASYVMTRLESVGDIIVFFGPFLLALFLRGLRLMRSRCGAPKSWVPWPRLRGHAGMSSNVARHGQGKPPHATHVPQQGQVRARACRELSALTALGVLTLLAMFLTGAFRTGETARACLFIYPYLIFPVAAYLQHHPCSEQDQRILLWLVFGQTVLMQTVAGYYW